MKMIDANHTFPTDGEFTGDAPPTDVKFTGDAPPTQSPPDIPDPNTMFFMEAMKTFHKYVLYMFEQFQGDIADIQRRVQMLEFVVDAHNHLGVEVATELKRLDDMTIDMDETLLELADKAILMRDPEEIDLEKSYYTGKPYLAQGNRQFE